MKVIVAAKEGATNKEKGDLLEDITQKLLESQNYSVEKELRNTGVELDLLCSNKANPNKQIYVECKAYAEDKKVSSETIAKLHGIRGIKSYEEAWLVSTSSLSKDAKGLVSEIEKGKDARYFTFYTPGQLIEALENANILCSAKTIKKQFQEFTKKRRTGELTLLFSSLGYFWCVEVLVAGEPQAMIFAHADTGDIVNEEALLSNLSTLQTPFKHLDHRNTATPDSTEVIRKPILKPADLKLNDSYIAQIDDLGMKFTHPEKAELLIDDVFVFPDLEEIRADKRPNVNSRLLLKSVNGPNSKYMIFGEDMAGKTSLVRILQKALVKEGLVPICLNAADIKRADIKKFTALLERKFKKQYGDSPDYLASFQAIIENDKSKIPLLIDDFEDFGIKRMAAQQALFSTLESEFNHIFLFANKSIELELMAKSETKEMLQNFTVYRILQLGHVRRDELIEKWLTVQNNDVLTDSYILNKKTELSKKINIAAGTNFVPTYPFYLLTMLQLLEIGSKSKLEGSSYAELYNYLVNQALLTAGVKPEDLDFYHTYLSYIAYLFFKRKIKSLTDKEMRNVFDEYLKLMDLEKSFETVNKILKRAKLLNHEDGKYSFYLNYCYYFFAAKYLSDNINEPEIKLTIEDVVQHLYRTEYANIVIFLIHHSKNSAVIKSILDQAKQLFSDQSPYTLSHDELVSINGLIEGEVRLLYKDSNPSENRKRELIRKDKLETKQDEADTHEENELDLFDRINFAFKIIEVLGQIANNYYGSLDGKSKVAIVNELYDLGFRGLHAFFGSYETYIEAIRQDFDNVIQNEKITIENDKDKVINKVIYTFSQLIALVFIKQMVESVASKNLFPTIDKVLEANPTSATKIVDISIRLNFPHGLSSNKDSITSLYKEFDKNYLSKDLLRFAVLDHMQKFEVKIADKQSICKKLDIDFVKTQRLLRSKPIGS